mmetsp:Transcript_21437/g.42067  ORF Transcript_21437/g.42067 Transcript_21437/m.42067 type:complete len:469 (+) Transcript_21437:156-1562(+)
MSKMANPRRKMRKLDEQGAKKGVKSQDLKAKKVAKGKKVKGHEQKNAKKVSKNTKQKLTKKQKILNWERSTGQENIARRLGLGRHLEGENNKRSDEDATDDGDILEQDMAFFSERIELVPITHLLPAEEEDEEAIISRKFMKNTKRQAPKQGVKEASKKAKRAAKFDEEPKSHMDLIKEHSEKLAATTRDQLAEDDGEKEENDGEMKPWGKTAPARSIAELKERLHAKMAELRKKRELDGEKKKRAPREGKKGDAKNSNNDSDDDESDGMDDDDDEAAERKLREQVAASISFGGLVNEDSEAISAKGKRVKSRNLLDVKRMLKQAEENKALLDELKSSTNLEDRERAKDQLWDKIEQKARGEAVAEPKHLRKIAKRLEKKKQKSSEEWAKRKQQVEDSKKERLDKRDANIAQARQRKVENKLRRKGVVLETNEEKPGRSRNRAGFEGRHAGFINDTSATKKTPSKKGE